MKFSLVYGNHGQSPSHLEDWLTFLWCAIADTGHEVSYSEGLQAGRVNVLLENFSDDDVDTITEAGHAGVDYIIVASEFLTGSTFNNFSDDHHEEGHYGNRHYWAKRCFNFLRTADHARAVWCVSDRQLSAYRDILDPAAVHRLELRWVPGYAPEKTISHKDVDFLFTGTMTCYRQAQIDRLKANGTVVAFLGTQTPEYIRRDYIRRSRVLLNIPQHAGWPHPSQMRYFHSIMHAAPMVGETVQFGCHLDPYVTLFMPANFAAAAMEALEAARSDDVGGRALASFRAEMPARDAMRNLIEQSLMGNLRRLVRVGLSAFPTMQMATLMIEEATRREAAAAGMIEEALRRETAAAEAFRNSTSWRVTAPLRSVRNLMHAVRRR